MAPVVISCSPETIATSKSRGLTKRFLASSLSSSFDSIFSKSLCFFSFFPKPVTQMVLILYH